MARTDLSRQQPPRVSARRTATFAAIVAAIIGVELLLFGAVVVDGPHPGALYFFTVIQDAGWLLLVSVCLGLLWIAEPRSVGQWADAWLSRPMAILLSSRRLPFALGLAVAAISLAGSWIVMRGFGLSLDEFLAGFQGDLILNGWPFGRVPEEWRWIQDALQPIFMHHDPEQGVWGPRYLPINGAIIALFSVLGVDGLAHALMAGGSIILLWRVARDVLPETPEVHRFAIILLASSPQFLVTAMTPYAMTTHLFFNLMWLWLLRRDAKAAQLAALIVGFLAIGIHQLHNFPTFAAPFLLAMMFGGRLRGALVHGAVYGLGVVFWIGWRDLVLTVLGAPEAPPVGASGLPGGVAFLVNRVLSDLSDVGVHDIAAWIYSVIRFVAWQNPLTVILFLLALRRWRDLPPPLRPFAWSIVVSLLPYILLVTDQGHGWGYRYIHGVLGNIALLAAWSWVEWRRHVDQKADHGRPMMFAGSLIALCVMVGLPLRAYQAAEVVHPYADALDWLLDRPADIVLVANNEAWYGVDLVRNDVELDRRPRLAALTVLGEERIAELCRHGVVTVVDGRQLQGFGIRPATLDLGPSSDEAREILRSAGCYAEPPS